MKRNFARSKKPEDYRKKKKIIFEFSTLQFCMVICILGIALFWMFGLGLTIGRGLSNSDSKSFWDKVVQMLGYEAPEKRQVEQASLSWEQPEKIKTKLTYYSELSKPPKISSPQGKKPSEEENPPPPEEKELAKSGSTNVSYTVLVASFKNRKNAEKLEQILKSKGYPVSHQIINIKGSTWYRVLVGNFRNRKDALRFVALFNKKEKLEAIVIHK